MKNWFSLKDFLANNSVPILLITALFSSVIYIYSLSDGVVFTLMTLFAFFYSVCLFILLEYLKNLNKNILTGLVLLLLAAASLILGSSLIETIHTDTLQWFFEPDKFTKIYIGNIFFIIFSVGLVLCSALYYFTRVVFRAVFVFLICMCPFSLFAKSFTDIPVIFTIVIITLFFLLLISRVYSDKSFCGINQYAAIGGFIIVVTAGAAFMPKLEFAPFREEFDEFITGINISGASGVNFNDFSDSSSSTGSHDEDEVIFTLTGDNPVLIKRQCFNLYNRDNGVWEYSGDVNTGYNHYDSYLRWENPSNLAFECGIEMKSRERYTIINYEGGNVKALYTPENLTNIEFPLSSLSDYADKNVYRTPVDEYFLSSDTVLYDSYAINWRDFDIDIEFMLLYDDEKAKKTGKSYSADYLKAKEEMKLYHSALMTESARKECYKNEKTFEQVKALVEEVTEGCTNDYTKAKAIEQYFKSDDFVYDKEFSVADGSVENFIFNTKRGICSNYATAMVLMCREAGLYSRYVEGFLIQKMDENGSYVVTAADSHAYVQVWLDGYGWTDFDPTSTNVDNDGFFDPTFLIVGLLMLAAALVGAVIFVIRPIIAERRFVRKSALLRGREQLLVVYPRISRLIHKELGIKADVMTVSELKNAAFTAFGADLTETADDFERSVYGDIDCGQKNYIKAYIGLKKMIKEKKSAERKAKRRRR